MDNSRVAMYIGNEIYPSQNNDPYATISRLHASPLTSAICGMINHDAETKNLVYNDGSNALFDNKGNFISNETNNKWKYALSSLRGGNIKELYLSFGGGIDWMAQNPDAAANVLKAVKGELGFDGIDIDDESGNFGKGSDLYILTEAAITAGLKLTAAPYVDMENWQRWITYAKSIKGTVSWLNLQCYAGGKGNNPGDWSDIGVPIVAGVCANCCCEQTTCSPADIAALFKLWTTGKGFVSDGCWRGIANTTPQTIGGGFIWSYSEVKGPLLLDYLQAITIQ